MEVNRDFLETKLYLQVATANIFSNHEDPNERVRESHQ